MKSYEEMIQSVVDNTDLRYTRWAAAAALSEIYGKSMVDVMKDFQNEDDFRKEQARILRKEQSQVSNEQRRQANLKKGGE